MKTFAIAGLPGSGKTTFLAALYYVLEEPSDKTLLTLTKLPDAAEYLQQISSDWAAYKAPDRSKIDLFEEIRLEVSDGSRDFEISFPDLSGEEFNDQWEKRTWSSDYATLVGEMNGLILFVSTDVKKPTPIVDYEDLVLADDDESPPKAKPFVPKESPHGVKLVEIIQFILGAREGKPFNLSVVVSAWDRALFVDGLNGLVRTPQTWLNEELPLLSQMLKNSSSIYWKVFGVSAQGVDYERNPEDSAKYFDGAGRIVVQDGDSVQNDLSAPLLWLMGDDT